MNDLIQAGKQTMLTLQRLQQPYWSLYYCAAGAGIFVFDDHVQPCHAGQFMLIPPDIFHAHQADSDAEHYFLYISEAQLSLRLPQLLTDDENQSILHLFTDAYYFHQQDESSSLLHFYVQLICQHISRRCPASPQSQLVEEIIQSISKNFANPNYELDTILHSAPYCYDYLCRLFRQEMHTTPRKYLSDLRLQAAADLLRRSSTSITDAARMCGHQDPLYFSRMFKKKYGCAPREYVRNNRQP